MASPRLATAQRFLAAFADLSVEEHLSVRTDDGTHVFAPASLGIGPTDHAAFAAQWTDLRRLIARFPVTPTEMVDSASDHAVTVWATSAAHVRAERSTDARRTADAWIDRGEYIFVLHTDATGHQIRRIVECVDSQETAHLLERVATVRANRDEPVTTT